MKNLLVLSAIFVLFFSGTTDPKRSDVYVQTNMFDIHYSEIYEQPTSVSYTVACTKTKFSQSGL